MPIVPSGFMVTICESRQGCCLAHMRTTAQLPGGIPVSRITPIFDKSNQADRYHVFQGNWSMNSTLADWVALLVLPGIQLCQKDFGWTIMSWER